MVHGVRVEIWEPHWSHLPSPLTHWGAQPEYTGHLFCALTVLEIVGTLGLMIYALLVEAGNLVDLPNKCIGFYNFCLWNETSGKLQCLEVSQLQAMGISWLGIALARVCVYICSVLSFFYPLFLANVMGVDKEKGWRALLIILITKMLLLSGGLGIFLLQTSPWINPSDFTGGFLALVGTMALILLQILTGPVASLGRAYSEIFKPLLWMFH
uniref:Transmembrane protein 140 n=1 Tax=Coturnix japonica TaxID=93934 RepID=A0A8C2T7D0_COTJA